MATVEPLAPIPESAASAGSMTLMLRQLKAGEETALAALHGRYGPLLIARARGRLRDAGATRRAEDEEDVVQEAFWSFYQSLKAEQIPRLENRRDFLALMTHIVACRVHIHLTHENAQKRWPGATAGASMLRDLAASPEPAARWVGKDALRDLASPATGRRLEARGRAAGG